MNQVRQTTVHGIRGLRLQTRAIGHAALSAGDRSHQHGVPPYILVTWVSGLVMPMLLSLIFDGVLGESLMFFPMPEIDRDAPVVSWPAVRLGFVR